MTTKRQQMLFVLLMVVPCAVAAQDPAPLPVFEPTLELPRTHVVLDAELFRPELVDATIDSALEPELGGLAPGAVSRFYNGHLVPRMSRYLDRLAPSSLADGLGTIQNVDQQVLHDELTDRTRRRALRSVSRAMRGYILESPVLDRFNRRIELGRDRVRDATSVGDGSRWGLTAGVSHGRPELGVDFQRGRAELRMSLDAFGSAAVSLRHERFDLLHVVASYDAREEIYDISCRLRF